MFFFLQIVATFTSRVTHSLFPVHLSSSQNLINISFFIIFKVKLLTLSLPFWISFIILESCFDKPLKIFLSLQFPPTGNDAQPTVALCGGALVVWRYVSDFLDDPRFSLRSSFSSLLLSFSEKKPIKKCRYVSVCKCHSSPLSKCSKVCVCVSVSLREDNCECVRLSVCVSSSPHNVQETEEKKNWKCLRVGSVLNVCGDVWELFFDFCFFNIRYIWIYVMLSNSEVHKSPCSNAVIFYECVFVCVRERALQCNPPIEVGCHFVSHRPSSPAFTFGGGGVRESRRWSAIWIVSFVHECLKINWLSAAAGLMTNDSPASWWMVRKTFFCFCSSGYIWWHSFLPIFGWIIISL